MCFVWYTYVTKNDEIIQLLSIYRFNNKNYILQYFLLQLLQAEMEDRLITAAVGQFPIEIQCKILTSHVHDANLKKEATIVIHESYRKIINVCKKVCTYLVFLIILCFKYKYRIQLIQDTKRTKFKGFNHPLYLIFAVD